MPAPSRGTCARSSISADRRRARWACASFLAGLVLLAAAAPSPGADLDWPPVRAETRPWTRWWWMGSAVDPAGLTAALEEYRRAGLGGVEITPIYGVRGQEQRFIPFLSPAWMKMLRHVLDESKRLDLGVDMATGTGWPFGGPWIGGDDACRYVAHRTYVLEGGQRLAEAVAQRQEPLLRAVRNPAPGVGRIDIGNLVEPAEANENLQALALDQVRFPGPLPLQVLMAYSERDEVLDLTARVAADGRLDWVAPAGRWKLYALFQGRHGKMVERAAPGGEGNVIDHFSARAIQRYLDPFDRAFAAEGVRGLRAFFNDSYEVDDASGQADWTPALLDEFHQRRGYDLRRHLPALFGHDVAEKGDRVLADYRQTISDLLLEEFTTRWREFAARQGAIVRNQAHGSPGALLDLYAAADIPETEGVDLMRIKWASSAAHVAGRTLVAAEAATWLGEHFLTTLADVRAALDRFFLGGVNHVVYHGTSYTPPGEPWPGWPFYASVHFNPNNSWWADFAALNAYVTRVQSFLQSGRADHDVLLYHPLYDALAVRGQGLLVHFGSGPARAGGSSFEAAARMLQERGFTHDFISDRQVRALRLAKDGRLETGGTSFATLVLPACRFVPLETVEAMVALARQGALVLVLQRWPDDVAGWADLDARRRRWRALRAQLRFAAPAAGGIQEAHIGRGTILIGDDLERLLQRARVEREPMVDRGLQFVRRSHAAGRYYFVSNQGRELVQGWIPLGTRAGSVTVFDPMHGRRGEASRRTASGGRVEVYVQLGAGESQILATTSAASVGEGYPYFQPAGPPRAIDGTWTVRFLAGGPELPAETQTTRLASWTRFEGDAVKAFSGTASYTIRFGRPAGEAEAWLLDLGQVKDSASVRINGRDAGTLIGPDYRLTIERSWLAADNVLEVRVSNLMANRIADLDRRNVPWKKSYNIGFPSRLPENRGPDGQFDASGWEPLDSGLLGPVTLTPLARPPVGVR